MNSIAAKHCSFMDLEPKLAADNKRNEKMNHHMRGKKRDIRYQNINMEGKIVISCTWTKKYYSLLDVISLLLCTRKVISILKIIFLILIHIQHFKPKNNKKILIFLCVRYLKAVCQSVNQMYPEGNVDQTPCPPLKRDR